MKWHAFVGYSFVIGLGSGLIGLAIGMGLFIHTCP